MTKTVPSSSVAPIKRGRGRNWASLLCRLKVGQQLFFSDGTLREAELIRQSCRYLRRSKGLVYTTRRFSYGERRPMVRSKGLWLPGSGKLDPSGIVDVTVRRIK